MTQPAENNNGKKLPKKRPTALKRDLQNVKRNERNTAFKSKVKTAIRSLKKSISEKSNADAVKEKFNLINSLLDKGAKKGVFKKNKASRVKSKMQKLCSKS
jgi:small subunit ribosomal protein S20